MGTYRKHLSGDMAFKSFVPTPISEIRIVHTERLDKLIRVVEDAMNRLNVYAVQLSDEQVLQFMRQEAEFSCKLASGGQPVSFALGTNTDDESIDDVENLLKATFYALEAMDELPLSARLLKNAHYLMCNSERYAKKYPGEFRSSPVWIGRKGSGLNDALFVPPAYEDMVNAFSDLEHFIHYTEENVFIKAAILHYQFEMIHPFIDANGRIGRLLIILFLYENKVSYSSVLLLSNAISAYIEKYYNMIQHVNTTGDIDAWVRFFLPVLEYAMRLTLKSVEHCVGHCPSA
ncbi:Fic family protein [Xylanibacter rodentium]|uniref:Fic family protein n=1 Tax=Xylanibacter rodentium TaxID=2736289 RepID=UPI0025951ABE|nr:Fic family protein [Xylanibacter rodentium]